MRILNKKGQMLTGLQQFMLGIAGVAIVLAVVLIVLAQLSTSTDNTAVSDLCPSAFAPYYNATTTMCVWNKSVTTNLTASVHTNSSTVLNSIIISMAQVPTWIGIIIVVALAFIVLGFFYMRSQGGM